MEILPAIVRQYHFQQLYNIADSLVAGKFVGENALAAVVTVTKSLLFL